MERYTHTNLRAAIGTDYKGNLKSDFKAGRFYEVYENANGTHYLYKETNLGVSYLSIPFLVSEGIRVIYDYSKQKGAKL